METRFQTSFIPKKPITSSASLVAAPRGSHVGGLFMTIAMALLVCSLLSVGGAYLWESYMQSQQTQLKNELAAREQQFDLSLIEDLQTESAQITLARQVLGQHIAVSQIFPIIQDMTDEHVRFLSLDLTTPATPGDMVKLTLAGYGQSLSTVAFQSDVLGRLEQYGLHDLIRNPILSNPSIGADGSVSFSLSATMDPSSLSYEKEVTGGGAIQSAASASTSSPMSASTTTP